MNWKKTALWIMFLALVLPLGADMRFLYEFTESPGDGSGPNSLIHSGTTLYGMTHGVFNSGSEMGTIFKIETDGTGFALLHAFAGGPADGRTPQGTLTLSEGFLYGTTMYGGSMNAGTVFRIRTDGTGYELLHEFKGGFADGSMPRGDLVLAGTTLFGMTMVGGSDGTIQNGFGTVFRMEIDGSGFSLLHRFRFNDGSFPFGGLTLSGDTLFGMTWGNPVQWNNDYCGTLFRIQTNGDGFVVLYRFRGGPKGGKGPRGSLLIDGEMLYGMTSYGGDSDLGTLFRIRKDGSGFALMHEFAGGPADGMVPDGSLAISGSTLYGTTTGGGEGDWGTVFKIQTNGSGFSLLHSFGVSDDAGYPEGTPLYHNSVLFGTASCGGTGYGGVIYCLPFADCILDLQAERKEVRAWVIVRHYAALRFRVEYAGVTVARYCVLRREGNGDFSQIRAILPGEVENREFRMLDKYLEADRNYTYRVQAIGEDGRVLGTSLDVVL